MVSTDKLFLLAEQLRADRALALRLRQLLRVLAQGTHYQAWAGGKAQARPYRVVDPDAAGALRRMGLYEDGLCVKLLNTHLQVFLTDGVWVDPAVRVFPFDDEARALLGLARRLGWDRGLDLVLELACGCGQAGLQLPAPCVLLLDINPRALAYAELNKALNAREPGEVGCALNDLRHGYQLPLRPRGAADQVLVLANAPFGLAPPTDRLPLSSAAGSDGLSFQAGVFKAVSRLRHELRPGARLRALVMGMSAGERLHERWDLVHLAEETLSAERAWGRVSWHLLEREGLVRVNGQRRLPNPAPLAQACREAAACELYFPDGQTRAALARRYLEMAGAFVERGRPDLAYGVVAIELNVPAA